MGISRRQFLGRSAAVVVAGTMASGRVFGANERIRMAVVGFNGRGGSHIVAWLKDPRTEIVAMCDVDAHVLERGIAGVKEKTNKEPKAYRDIRDVVADPEIDAVSIATPNHWHSLGAIWAMENGKDVYVEKPCSHNVFEGRQLVNAAKKYNRICQHGTQIRSSKAIQEAMKKLHDGAIGEVYMARGLCYKSRDSIGKGVPADPPAHLDWNLWQGPAPETQYMRREDGLDPRKDGVGGLHVHYNWHWFWNYGNGDIGNQGVHQMDVARWGLGVKQPSKVQSMGGHFIFDDAKEVHNTITSAFYYPDAGTRGKMLVFETRPWLTNDEGGAKIGNLFYGSEGYMVIDSYSHYKLFRKDGTVEEGDEGGDHYGNFIDAVLARDPGLLAANAEEGHLSSCLCHLGLISTKLGRSFDFDPAAEQVLNDDEANAMLRPEYREPFVVKPVEV